MGKILVILLLVLTTASLLLNSWVSASAYFLNSLIQPQHIWHWVFADTPVFKITAGLTFLGFLISLARREIDIFYYKDKQNFFIIFLLFWMFLSDFFSPYKGSVVSVSPEIVLGTITSIVVMYCVLIGVCQKEIALKSLCLIFAFSCIFYTVWANLAYFNQEWYRFSGGRLEGPLGSPYGDANVLSVLLVMGLPYLILGIYFFDRTFIKLALICSIPFVWHALVLFSSRGALLASVLVLLPLAFIIKSKRANILLAFSFFSFVLYQGAMVLNRASEVVEVAKVSTEPVNPRLISWEAAVRLIPEYPVLGAGVQMFEAAVSDKLPGFTPHVAHNTFLNFAANCGLVAGFLFLGLIVICFKRFRSRLKTEYDLKCPEDYALFASSISIFGYFICSVFLDLIIFEPFYFALLINLVAWKRLKEVNLGEL